jgi:hypothetical protein
MSAPSDDEAVIARVLTEYNSKISGWTAPTFKETMELREYTKSRTDLRTDQLTPEQAAWKSLYIGLTEGLRKSFPDAMAEIERLEEHQDRHEVLMEMMTAKLKARPHDYGVKVWWGFLAVGILVGWLRSRDVWSALILYGLAFGAAGLFFCIFAIDSAEFQSTIAIFLNRIGVKRISRWLYRRALTIR